MRILKENVKKFAASFVALTMIMAAIAMPMESMFVISARAEGESSYTETIFDFGSDGWSYKKAVSDGELEATGYTIDAGWTSNSKMPIGFGKDNSGVKNYLTENSGTIVASGSCGNLAIQKNINITKADYDSIYIDTIFDDGALVYVNGNLAAALGVRPTDGGSSPVSQGYIRKYTMEDPFDANQRYLSTHNVITLDKSLFVDGNNTISVLLLNDTVGSSDIFVDMRMTGVLDAEATPLLIDFGSDGWKYKTYAQSDTTLANATMPDGGVDDSTWTATKTPIGFGTKTDFAKNLASGRTLGAGENSTGTSMVLQKTINITDKSKYSAFYADVNIDDGALIFVNGKLASSINATSSTNAGSPAAPYLYGYRRDGKVNDAFKHSEPASTLLSRQRGIEVNSAGFKNGANVITVVILNEPASSTLYGDVKLVGVPAGAELALDKEIIAFGSSEWSYKTYSQVNEMKNAVVPEGGITTDVTWKTSAKLPVGFGSKTNFDAKLSSGTKLTGTEAAVGTHIVLQKTVNIENPSQYKWFSLDADIDDGAVVYVNGNLVADMNVTKILDSKENPDGIFFFGFYRTLKVNDAFKASELQSTDLSTQRGIAIPTSAFSEGNNVITMAVVNERASSTLYADLKLTGMSSDYVSKTPGAGATSISKGDEWLWKKNSTGIDWTSKTYMPEGAWKVGATPIGYGTTVSTSVPFNADTNNCQSVYLRRYLTITDMSNVKSVKLNLSLYHSATVYFNGAQVLSVNKDGAGNNTIVNTGDLQVSAKSLTVGENVVGVILHNTDPKKSPMSFDMSLETSNEEYEETYESEKFVMTPGSDSSEMGFAWYTVSDMGSDVKIAKSSDMVDGAFPASAIVYTGTASAVSGSVSHKVTATGLAEGETYSYCYGNAGTDVWSETATFNTQTTDNGYTAIFVGDPQIGAGSSVTQDGVVFNNNINAALNAYPNAGMIITAGDNTDNYNGDEREYASLLKADKLSEYPLAPSMGNHDCNPALFGYHFNRPNESATLGRTGGGGNYYYSYGNTLYIKLNSNNQNVAEHVTFISEAKAAHPTAKWNVVVMHHDVYGAGNHALGNSGFSAKPLQQNLVPKFEELGIDIVLAGHDHTYARSHIMKNQTPQKTQNIDSDGAILSPDGILYVTASSSSESKFYGFAGNPDYLAKRDETKKAQFTVLEVSDTDYSIKTYVSDGMRLIDEVTVRKEASAPEAELQSQIKIATSLYENAVEGAAKVALKAEIDRVTAIANTSGVTGQQISDAIAEMKIAISAFNVEANKKPLTGVSLNQSTASLEVGGTVSLTVGYTPSNTTDDKTVVWTSDAEAIATVSNGVVTAVSTGTAKITATVGTHTAECTITVVEVPTVTDVKLSKTKMNVKVKGTATLTATVSGTVTNKAVTWKSENSAIAKVNSNGKVTGVKAGKVKITATSVADPSKKAECTITVTKPVVKVKSVKIKQGSKIRKKITVKFKKGRTIKLKAVINPKGATNKTVTWKSSKKKVATISKKGIVKIKKKGKTTITLRAKNGKKFKCVITIK